MVPVKGMLQGGSWSGDLYHVGAIVKLVQGGRLGLYRVTSAVHDSVTVEPYVPEAEPLEQMADDAAALGLWAELLALSPEVSDGTTG